MKNHEIKKLSERVFSHVIEDEKEKIKNYKKALDIFYNYRINDDEKTLFECYEDYITKTNNESKKQYVEDEKFNKITKALTFGCDEK